MQGLEALRSLRLLLHKIYLGLLRCGFLFDLDLVLHFSLGFAHAAEEICRRWKYFMCKWHCYFRLCCRICWCSLGFGSRCLRPLLAPQASLRRMRAHTLRWRLLAPQSSSNAHGTMTMALVSHVKHGIRCQGQAGCIARCKLEPSPSTAFRM